MLSNSLLKIFFTFGFPHLWTEAKRFVYTVNAMEVQHFARICKKGWQREDNAVPFFLLSIASYDSIKTKVCSLVVFFVCSFIAALVCNNCYSIRNYFQRHILFLIPAKVKLKAKLNTVSFKYLFYMLDFSPFLQEIFLRKLLFRKELFTYYVDGCFQ